VAQDHLGGAAAWGLILTGGGVGGVIGGVLALRLRPRRPLMTGFMIMAAVSLPPLALVGPLPVLLIAGASMLSLVSIELANTWWYTMLQQHVPDHARSRVSSYDWLVSLVFQPLGFLLAGPLAEWIGLTATLVGAAVIGLLANYGVLLVRAVREVRWVKAAEAPPAAAPPA
jgi:predicted MFS family arabinose efflux permease